MMNEMQRREVRYGLETMCIGGGQGIAAIFERANVDPVSFRALARQSSTPSANASAGGPRSPDSTVRALEMVHARAAPGFHARGRSVQFGVKARNQDASGDGQFVIEKARGAYLR